MQFPPSYRGEGRANSVARISSNNFRAISDSRSSSGIRLASAKHHPASSRNYRVCWVWSDTSPLNERNLAPFEFQPLTTDFIYLRLLGHTFTKYDGDGKRIHRYDKLLWKREAALDSWALRIQRHLDRDAECLDVCGNHYEGFAPETASGWLNGWASS